jgi:hypothetical protein
MSLFRLPNINMPPLTTSALIAVAGGMVVAPAMILASYYRCDWTNGQAQLVPWIKTHGPLCFELARGVAVSGALITFAESTMTHAGSVYFTIGTVLGVSVQIARNGYSFQVAQTAENTTSK